ncbi:MAG: amidohydrolase [Cytophagaceae bacterium]|nr:amidohydrolase [Cytophagaceae bacterium]
MQDLKITLIQSPLHWESPEANLAMFEEKIWKIDESTDIIVLPEMFTTGFTMNAEKLAEPLSFRTLKWMRQMAAQTKSVITGSIITKEKENFYNRLLWMEPDGNFSSYDKRHLFRMADEDKIYSEGKTKIIKEVKGWKVFPIICYDLRFPVWCRNKKNAYDLLICVANWPSARRHAWNTLLRARAIENISYVAGLNRTGTDGRQLEYSGDSAVIDFKGEDICNFVDREEICTEVLSYESLKEFRKKFPAHLDADDFEIKN